MSSVSQTEGDPQCLMCTGRGFKPLDKGTYTKALLKEEFDVCRQGENSAVISGQSTDER